MVDISHSRKRREQIVGNLREVIKIVKDGGKLSDGYGFQIKPLHDISRDLDYLTRHAELWEEYCRDTNHHPSMEWNNHSICAGEAENV